MLFLTGISLFFLGLLLAQQYLRQAGSQLINRAVDVVSKNVILQIFSGFLLALVLQSSSAATVVIISLAGAGLLAFSEAYPMLFGAAVGSTVVVQIISLRLFDAAPLMLLAGILGWVLVRRDFVRYASMLLIVLGLVFTGMELMESGVKSSLNAADFINSVLYHIPGLWGFFAAGFAVTAIFQASAFVIGVVMILTLKGQMQILPAMAIVLGANAGTAVTGVLAVPMLYGEGRRIAVFNVVLKCIPAMLFCVLLPHIPVLALPGKNAARIIANFHFFYNLIVLILMVPFKTVVTTLADKVWSVKPSLREEFRLEHLKPDLTKTPSIALRQARKEIARLASLVIEMANLIPYAFSGDRGAIEEIRKRDDVVDYVEKNIRMLLTHMIKENLSSGDAKIQMAIVLTANHLENIADVMARNLVYLAEKKMRKALDFSQEGKEELHRLHRNLLHLLKLLRTAVEKNDRRLVEELQQEINGFKNDVASCHIQHLQRLQEGLKESIVTSSVHIDILGNYERIADYILDCVYMLHDMLPESKK